MTGNDPLLVALTDAAQRKRQADREIRLLLAYARELATPRPYRLADLANAAGMSISGVRLAYTQADITRAAYLTKGGYQDRHLEAMTLFCSLMRQPAAAREHHPAA
jgi:AraC-like DNA-binding protein